MMTMADIMHWLRRQRTAGAVITTGSIRLHSHWHAVLASGAACQVAFVPMFSTVAVFWSEFDQDGNWRTVHVGDMPEAPMDFDELIQYVEELTKTSPPTEPETPTETPA